MNMIQIIVLKFILSEYVHSTSGEKKIEIENLACAFHKILVSIYRIERKEEKIAWIAMKAVNLRLKRKIKSY